jgi:hypothetical protein
MLRGSTTIGPMPPIRVQNAAQPPRLDAERAGLVVTGGEYVDPSAQQDQRMRPTKTPGKEGPRSRGVTEASDPGSQKVMAGSWS